MTNKDRAAIAAEALLLVDENIVADLLANLMHYCDEQRISFEAELRDARMHHREEVAEEA